MISEKLTGLVERSKDNIINLGCANGWGPEYGKVYLELQELKIPGSYEYKELGRCWHQHSFKVNINENEYTVIHTEDSGD